MPGPDTRLMRGFTLTEILVVIAIVAVLLGLLLPAMAHIQESGRRTSCQNNLRQLAQAMQLYVQENDGQYPVVIDWGNKIQPHLKNREVLQCPSDPRAYNPADASSSDYWLNLSLNQLVFDRPGGAASVGKHEATLADPVTVFLCGDMTGSVRAVTNASGTSEMNVRHFDGANYSFVDGHVKWLTPKTAAELECSSHRTR